MTETFIYDGNAEHDNEVTTMVIIRNSKYYKLSQNKDNKQYYIEKKLQYGRTSIVRHPSSYTKKSKALARYNKLVKMV